MGDAPGADELESRPSKVAIVATRVDGDIEDPAYIMTCATARVSSTAATCAAAARRCVLLELPALSASPGVRPAFA